jgi:two-component system chemotaxis response regulator CheB
LAYVNHAPDTSAPRFELIVVVASFGGLAATSSVLAALPAGFEVPIALVQHRSIESNDGVYAEILRRRTTLPVSLMREATTIRRPGVTLVPAGAVARVDHRLRYELAPADTTPTNPGDTLMMSAAGVLGPAVIGVVLSGRLSDGAAGVRAVKRRGGRSLAQDTATAGAAGMPSSAAATGCVDFILPADRIAAALVAWTMAPGGAELFAVPTPSWAQLGA